MNQLSFLTKFHPPNQLHTLSSNKLSNPLNLLQSQLIANLIKSVVIVKVVNKKTTI